ncbi:hypothetical protein LENED_012266 [Lentinula edodes]|uniref:Uncharacterized protein n=1 Tax=Lentinula edodes TaxID=5353 RepID=A0A1Q3ES58_LENED|nr:uncharacterized protein C8R40DRAFT_1072420 [Lentinula edodes]KAH7871676.1 hypothetical protein C8R40DRAFT_1072420 [Lentinula edodes]KAJ3912656.1 hypothetical protein F5877DRAFT_84584 [Lentinula edodes]GAW10041.1 hypothetical protein LENED_012266 [Lentinula edodes]
MQLVSACTIPKLYFFLFVGLQLFLAKTVQTVPISPETVRGGSSSDLILDNHDVTLDVSNTARLSSNRARAEGPTIIQAHIVVNTSLETPDDVLFSIHDAAETILNLVTSDIRKSVKQHRDVDLPEDLAVELSSMYVYPTGGKEYYTVEYIIFDGMSDGKSWVHPRTEAQNWKMLIGKQSFTGLKDRSPYSYNPKKLDANLHAEGHRLILSTQGGKFQRGPWQGTKKAECVPLPSPNRKVKLLHDTDRDIERISVSFPSVAYEEPQATSKMRELARKWIEKWVGPAWNSRGPSIPK